MSKKFDQIYDEVYDYINEMGIPVHLFDNYVVVFWDDELGYRIRTTSGEIINASLSVIFDSYLSKEEIISYHAKIA